MDFGRVPDDQLDKIDFRLPDDPVFNRRVLQGKPAASPKGHVAAAKWGRKEWIGLIYPKGTKDPQFLDQYVKHFNSIELNATHYKLYAEAAVQKWVDKVEKYDFLFCPKFYQGISHYGSFDEKQFLTDIYFQGITAFGKHLGPTFLQVSDKFSPKRKKELFDYLKTLPRDIEIFLEIRHPDWYSNKQEFNDVINLLRDLHMGIVITDTAGRRDVLHGVLTIPKTYIRFSCNAVHPTSYKRMDDWVERIKLWLTLGLEQFFFVFHPGDEAYTPILSRYIINRLNEELNLSIRAPKMIAQPKLDL